MHAEDVASVLERSGGCVGNFHAAGLAAPAYQHLRFNYDATAQFSGNVACLLFRFGHPAAWDGNSICRKDCFRLILVKFHLIN